MINKILRIAKKPYVFSVISEFFSIIVAFLFTIFQARFLGAEIKGQVAIINSVLGITSIVFGMGINQSYAYYRKKYGNSMISIFMKISIMIFLVYMLISLVLIKLLNLDLKYVAVFIITPLCVYGDIVSEITLIELPNRRNGTNMLVNFSELLFVLVLWIVARPTLILGISIIAFKNLVKSITFTILWRKQLIEKSIICKKFLIKLIRFGFFPMLAVLMSTLNYRVDVLMLNGHVTDAQIGIYSIGVLLADRMWMVPDAMKGVMVSNIAKGKDAREAAYVLRICNSLCLVIIIGILLLGNAFIDFAFGSEYKGAFPITIILLLGVFPMINYKIIAAYNNIIGKQKVSFVMLSISVILNIVANYVLIPLYGIYGAGIASVISYAACSVLFIIYFCRITKIKFFEMLVVNKDDILNFTRKLKMLVGK